jgi:DNA repair photolyase
MVISASRRTDIPAFYSRWFTSRLKAGFVDIANPFNPAQIRRVDLRPEAVDAIVFWTRNPRPLLTHLRQLDDSGYNYYFLYTVTGYPKLLEPNLPSPESTVESFKKLSDRIGPERVIWRYDPIILSSLTDPDFHLKNFESLASLLAGATTLVIISFLDFYKKSERRLSQLSLEHGVEWQRYESHACKNNDMLIDMKQIADAHGISMQSCAEEYDLVASSIARGSCIDYRLINDLFKLDLRYKKDPSPRKSCLCGLSVDIGAYNTCGYRCQYCYANNSFERALLNLRRLNQESPSMAPILTGERS